MQYVLRPYATAGVALVGASLIAVTPVAAPLPEVQARSVKLVDAWTDLVADTTENLTRISANADQTAIAEVFQALVSNPIGVIQALTNLDPTVTTDLGSLPGTINIELPPGLELALAQLGAEGATLNAINDIAEQLASNPSGAFNTLLEAPATIANAFLNGQDNISLLNGLVNIAGFNGVLAPLQDVSVNLNLADLLDALGVGNLDLSSLDLSGLLSQLGLGNLSLGDLFSDLGLSGKGLGDLLASAAHPVTTLTGVLDLLGLDEVGSGLTNPITLGLTNVLEGLGFATDQTLNSLTLSDVLVAFGINSPLSDLSDLSLSGILSSFGVVVPDGATLGATSLSSLIGDLGFGNLGIGTLLQNAVDSGVLGPLAGPINLLLTTSGNLLNEVNLGQLLTGLTLGQGGSLSLDQLLGDLGINLPSTAELDSIDIGDVLSGLGINLPDNLSLGDVLGQLGFAPTTGDLTLGTLLTDLGNPFGALPITELLNGLTVGGLLSDLGLSDTLLTGLPGVLDLGDLSNLTLDGLLGDLGLGDIAMINIDGFGGLDTLLVDVVPQQILAALGM